MCVFIAQHFRTCFNFSGYLNWTLYLLIKFLDCSLIEQDIINIFLWKSKWSDACPLQVRMGRCSLSPPSTSVSTRISVTVSLTVLLYDSWECDVVSIVVIWRKQDTIDSRLFHWSLAVWSVQDPSTKRRSRKRRRGSRMKSCVFPPSQRFPLVGHTQKSSKKIC